MPQRHSEILVLHIYGEVPYEDLAAKHRLSVNAVKAIYREAKIILKENLINE